ncbi:MAG TPA: mechanosensitive ion channel domain-containing protein [Nitrospiraceae bacterium]|nr:mechanosensitive ion channel domain-containing protein [Nitrospiraceae bacterium]
MERLLDELVRQIAVLAPKVGMAILVFLCFWFASLLLRRFILRLSQATDFNTRYVLRLAGRTASVALVIFGAVSALGTVGINVSALVAGLGLTGFALGFALKDVLSNFMAGVLILLYRPFQLNDYISVAGLEGTVTEIDLRYTTLQKEGQKFLIPNSILFTNSIGLIGEKGYRG